MCNFNDYKVWAWVGLWLFNTTDNNIIWQSVLLVKETREHIKPTLFQKSRTNFIKKSCIESTCAGTEL